MRLLHTSDWHIGVTTRGVSRSGDLSCALDELLEVCADFKPDLIIHSGDLFHQPRPLVDELELAWSGLRRLAEHAPVVATDIARAVPAAIRQARFGHRDDR